MRQQQKNYRLVILGACIIIMFVMWGLGNHPLALYAVPITTAYGFPRSLFSIIFSIINLFSAFGNLFFGAAVKKMGLKNVMVVGTGFAVLAYGIYYLAASLPMFYIASALFGLALAFLTNSPASVLINNWFGKNKGLALGIVFMSSGIGGTVCDIMVGRLINSLGFKASLGISALIISGATVLAVFLIKPRPAVKLPPASAEPAKAEEPKDGVSFRRARRTPSFWLVILTEAFWGLSIIPIVATMPTYLNDKGFDPLFVSGVVMASLYAVSAASKLGLGVVSDKLGTSVMVGIVGVAGAVATLLLATAASKGGALASSLLMGVAFSCMTIPVPILTSSIFGNKDYGVLVGIFSAVLTLAGALGTPLVNLVFDLSGTYVPVFIAQAVFFALSIPSAILAIKYKPVQKKAGSA